MKRDANGAPIYAARWHFLKRGFPLIVRVLRNRNANKMPAEKKVAAMTVCHCLLQYTTYMLSCQSEATAYVKRKCKEGLRNRVFKKKLGF